MRCITIKVLFCPEQQGALAVETVQRHIRSRRLIRFELIPRSQSPYLRVVVLTSAVKVRSPLGAHGAHALMQPQAMAHLATKITYEDHVTVIEVQTTEAQVESWTN